MNSPDAATEEVRAPEPPIRLLLVEDSEIDCEMLLATLRRQGMDIRCTRVEDGPAMRSALAHDPPDAIISDHRLPAFSSTAAYDVLRETGLDLPFIIVSGAIGEEAAVEAMRRGVDDYLIKGRLARLSSALRNAIASSRLRRAQRRTQEELARSKQALEQLSAHLLEKIEDERTALAREIHDDVGGTLASLRFDLAWIERHGSTEVSERARRTVESVAEAMAAVQRLIRDLRPPVLDAGIVAALEWQLDQFRRRTGLATRFSSNVESIELPDELAIVAYRTLQEALTNVIKHAAARQVIVDLVATEQVFSLEVSDDGRGIAPGDRDKPSSFGLRGLAERARQAGGWIETSSATSGTSVLMTLEMPGSTPATELEADG